MLLRAVRQCDDWTIALAAAGGGAHATVTSLEAGGLLRCWQLVLPAGGDVMERPTLVGVIRAYRPGRMLGGLSPRAVQLSADQSLLLLLSSTGALRVLSLPAPASADATAEPLPLPSLAAHVEYRGAQLVRHGSQWAVVAWADCSTVHLHPVPEVPPRSAAHSARSDSSMPAHVSTGLPLLRGAKAASPSAACAAGLAARWLPSGRGEAAGGAVLVLCDKRGTLHIQCEPRRGAGGELQALGTMSFERGWPALARRKGKPTPPDLLETSSPPSASLLLASEGLPHCLLGHLDGSVSRLRLSGNAVLPMRARHTARVTALLPIRGRGGVQCTHFASSAADGVVMLWRLREAVPIACFSEHVGAIRALLQPGPALTVRRATAGSRTRLARTRLARRVPIRGRAAHRPQLVQSRTWHPRTTLPRTVLTRGRSPPGATGFVLRLPGNGRHPRCVRSRSGGAAFPAAIHEFKQPAGESPSGAWRIALLVSR